MTELSRRLFLGGAAALTAHPAFGQRRAARMLVNLLVRQRADAQIFRHTDGSYYMTASVSEYDRLIVRRARTLCGLAGAREVVV